VADRFADFAGLRLRSQPVISLSERKSMMIKGTDPVAWRTPASKTGAAGWFQGFVRQLRAVKKKGWRLSASSLLLAALIIPAGATAPAAQGQQNPPAQTDTGSKSAAPESKATPRNGASIQLNSELEYRISPNDLIEIKIDKAEELSGTYPVTAAGSITMKFLGRITVQGKTSDEIATQIADGLRGRYLIEPDVRVVVTQRSGQSYFIQGAVRSPGLFQIQGRLTLLELITIAGGLAENHGSTAYLIRKVKPAAAAINVSATTEAPQAGEAAEENGKADEVAKFELVKANISGLLKGNLNNNILVEGGDIVNIPPTDVFFVSGAVQAPGSFPLKAGTTLRQAISLAQGPNSKASLGKSVIYREDPASGKQLEIKVDIGAVMNGKRDDIAILPNDIIQIPDSRLKSIRNTVLTTFGFSATRIVGF
jgi:polysaccharide biosynthesis/export protein